LILAWQEHLPKKEMPPRWMWALDVELNLHFERVERQREDPDDRDDDEPRSVGPMLENEYAKNRGRNAR
jgi:thymidylate kinase